MYKRQDVDHAASQFKIGTELLIYYHKFFLQGEYIRAHVKREKGFENYTAQDVYKRQGTKGVDKTAKYAPGIGVGVQGSFRINRSVD